LKAVVCAAFAALLAASGCSGSSSSDAGAGGSSEPPASSTSVEREPPTSTSSEPSPAPATTERSDPAPIPRGTAKIAPRRLPPPPERLPAFRAVKIADANYPSGLAAAPDGRILFSELWEGQIRVIGRDGSVDPEPWADVNATYRIRWTEFFHGGLSGIAFDPNFSRNRFVYVVTQVPDKRTGFAEKTLVIRYKERKGRGTSPRVILTLRAKKFDNTYSLVFGPDGMLYVPNGFLGTGRAKGAHPLDDVFGKILRVTPTGKAPGDNPYGKRAPRVWASGFKNAFDLAFFPRSDLAVAGENGTVGHDEINLLMPGRDYGYPSHEGVTRIRRLTPPLLDFGSGSPAPTGIVYYSGRRYPALRSRFLMCNNDELGMVALRIRRSDPGRLLAMTSLVDECTLDLVQTPDGSVVFSDAGAIYRLEPGG
jgi:glucose/arabinose dehydrogenase